MTPHPRTLRRPSAPDHLRLTRAAWRAYARELSRAYAGGLRADGSMRPTDPEAHGMALVARSVARAMADRYEARGH